jgi:hypothetical protein
MSPGFKRYLVGVAIGLVLLVGLLVAAEFAPLAGLLVSPVLLALVLWAEGWTVYGLGAIALVILLAFAVQRATG